MTELDLLLLVGGAVAALGGATKFRPGIRNRMGTSPLALAELGVAALAALLGFAALGGPFLGWGVVVLLLVTVVASALHQSSINRSWRELRAASEEARLAVFMRSRAFPADGSSKVAVPPPGPAGDADAPTEGGEG